MPRYYFHTADGSRDRDFEGTDFASHRIARVEAIKFAGSVLSEHPDVLDESRDFRVEVTDKTDMLLFTVIILAINAPASGRT